ncbi:MAG TPA: c-type cytochrome [Candidatus Limnocylindria bacterium]|nr:c-type cytochrome [Candidatus Limnocylindria bacterium]
MPIRNKFSICNWALLLSIVILLGCGRDAKAPTADQGHQHGTESWVFTLPKGDPVVGRELFVEAQCYNCHEVKGEKMPPRDPDEKTVGPELSQMAGLHPVEFFAESIIHPNAFVPTDAKERDYVGPDGRSKMPDFSDVFTVKQVADLAAYIASLGGGGHGSGGHKH